MPGYYGRYYWRFVGKQPAIVSVVAGLFLANMATSFTLSFLGKYLIPRDLPNSHICSAMLGVGVTYSVPNWICWYAERKLIIHCALLGLVLMFMLIYRKNLESFR